MRTLCLVLGSILVWSCAGTEREAAQAPQSNPCSAACKPDGGSDCSCIFNDECSPGFRCGTENNGTCECAARGTGKLNDPCTTPNACASGVCIELKDHSQRCTLACDPARTDQCTGLMAICNTVVGLGSICWDH